MILGFLIGILIGLAIASIIIVCFTNTSLSEFIGKLIKTDYYEMLMVAGVSVLTFLLSIPFVLFFHELGHLVFGIISGYKFVSFRVFNYTMIRVDGMIKVKKFAIEGTGGQCLLTPPDIQLDKIPTTLYIAGGLIANLILLLAAISSLVCLDNPMAKTALFIFILTDAMVLLINGIPMKINGLGNDAYDMLLLRRSQLSKQGFIIQLKSNALIQNGTRPKDLPSEWFVTPTPVDYSNPLEVSLPLEYASILIDRMKYSQAILLFNDLYNHKEQLIPLYIKEVACELTFLNLVSGHVDEAKKIIADNDLMKYVQTYRKVMSSKDRILCAITLYVDGNRKEAERIFAKLLAHENDYLLQGEVKSDLALMKSILQA